MAGCRSERQRATSGTICSALQSARAARQPQRNREREAISSSQTGSRESPYKRTGRAAALQDHRQEPGTLQHLREIDTAAAESKPTAKEQPITKKKTAVQPTPAHKQKKELREIDTDTKAAV